MIEPEKKAHALARIAEYYSGLMDEGFSGRVTTRFDRGHMQELITREQTDKLHGLSTR